MEDVILVAGLRARDSKAIEAFWQDYFEELYPICAYILGDGPDALDTTVDLMVDFVDTRVQRLSKPEALYSYLRLMAVRRSIRFRDRRYKTVALDEANQEGSDSSPEEKVSAHLLMPILEKCLETLSPKAQKTLRLKYKKKISNEKIGRHLGGSKQYIGRLINSSLKALRLCIESKGDKGLPLDLRGES